MCKLAVGEALLGNPEEVLCQLSPGLITSVAKKRYRYEQVEF